MGFVKNKIENSVVEKFLERVCIDLELELRRTVSTHELGENPLCYREETLGSFLFPALNGNSIRTLMEVSYTVTENKKEVSKFVDYYSLDKTRKCSYLIEAKHSFWQTYKSKFYETNKKRWRIVNEQINRYEPEIIKEYIDSEKDIYGISFYMMTVVSNKDMPQKEGEAKILENIEKEFKGPDLEEPDWIWIYTLPEELQDDVCDEDGDTTEEDEEEIYSHFVILGKVRKVL